MITFTGQVHKFPGRGGWFYVLVPQEFAKQITSQAGAWGMVPITVTVGDTTWTTKLMRSKEEGYFIALKALVRKNEHIVKDQKIKVKLSN